MPVSYALLVAVLALLSGRPVLARSSLICSEEDHDVYQYYTTQLELSKVPKTEQRQDGSRLQLAVTIGHCPRDCSTSRQTIEAPIEQLVEAPFHSKTGSVNDIFAASVPIVVRLSEVPSGEKNAGGEDIGSIVLSWEVTAPYLESIGDKKTYSLDLNARCESSPTGATTFCGHGYEGKAALLVERVASLGQVPPVIGGLDGGTEHENSTRPANVSSPTAPSNSADPSPLSAAAGPARALITNSSVAVWYWYEAAVALDPQEVLPGTISTPQGEVGKEIAVNLLLDGQPIVATSGDGSNDKAFAAGTTARGASSNNTEAAARVLILRLDEQGKQGNRHGSLLEKNLSVPVLSRLCDLATFEFPFNFKEEGAACTGSSSSCEGVKGTAVVQIMRIVPPAVLPREFPPASPPAVPPAPPTPVPSFSALRGNHPAVMLIAGLSLFLVF